MNIQIKNPNQRRQRHIWRSGGPRYLVLALLLGIVQIAIAEGTREVAPTVQNLVMLEVNRPGFGEFAAYNGPENSRLYISIDEDNPTQEVVYIGLSGEYDANGNPLLDFSSSQYQFRIRRDEGGADPVVHGPFNINVTNANVTSWNQSLYGNYSTATMQAGQKMYEFEPTQGGDYYIEFLDFSTSQTDDERVLIGYWDITVTKNDVVQDGRVWSRNWAFRTPKINGTFPEICEWDQEFAGTLFSYTSDKFVSKIDFSESGFQGLSFTVAFNSRGPGNSGDVIEDRKSVPFENATGAAAEHQIFLNEPDSNIFEDGECGEIVAGTIFNCETDTTFCLDVAVTRPGVVDIFLDFDRNGEFDADSEDVNLAYNFTADELSACVPWDGIKGNGQPAAFGDTINLIFIYSQGIQNWAVYDAEVMRTGFCVESVRPNCVDVLNTDQLYWDDRDLPLLPGTGQPVDGRNGCECGFGGCRTWNNFNTNVTDCMDVVDSLTTGYGDKHTLNTWWFANIIVEQTVNVPLLTCQITGDTTLCPGDSTTLVVEVSGTSAAFNYLWTGPGVDGETTSSVGPLATPGEYCVFIVDEEGCETTCCVMVSTLTPPGLNGSTTDATCFSANDGSISLVGSGGTGALMYSIDGSNFQPEDFFGGLLPGDYTAFVMDEEGCTATIDLTVGEMFDDDISYQDSHTICLGESVALNPSMTLPYTYEWSPATGLDNANIPNPTASPETTTTYTVSITIAENGQICTFTQEVTVNVLDGPGLSVEGAGAVCTQNTTLEAMATGPGVTFAWVDTQTGDTLQLGDTFDVQVPDSVAYLLQGLDADGCFEDLLVTAVYDPVEVSLPDTLAICLGESFNLAVTNLDPTDVLTYNWTPASAFASGTDTATPDVIETLGETQVMVEITNQAGCIYTDSVQLAVIDPDIDLSFTTMPACDGATVQFTNTSTNAFGYLWNFGDGTTSTEVSPSHVYTMPGIYTVTLSSLYDASCTPDAVSSMVTITDPLVFADFTYDITSCGLDEIEVQFFDNSTNTFNNDLTYDWTFSNGQTSTEANPVITLTQEGPLTVTLSITTANNCTNTRSVTLTFDFIEFNVADTLIRCVGTALELNPGGNTNYTYDWSPAAGLSATDIANPVATPDVTTTYTVTIENISADTCTFTQTVTVLVPAEIGVDAGADQTTCGEEATLSATTNDGIVLDSIFWTTLDGTFIGEGASVMVNPDDVESYIVTAIDNFGCEDRDTVLVDNQEVNVEMPDDIISCDPYVGPISITNLDPGDVLTYSWTPLSNIVSGADTAMPTVSVDEGTVVFTVEITNQFNCTTTEAISLTAGVLDVGLPDTVRVCTGSTAPLNPGGSASFTYTWAPADGLDDATSNNPTFIGSASTTYTVTVSDNSTGVLCELVDTVAVIVGPKTILTINTDTTICEEGPFNLANLAPGFDDVSWFDNPSLTPPAIGTGDPVVVDLTAGDFDFYGAILTEEACSDTVLVNVQVTNFQTGLDDLEDIQVCAGFETPLNPDGNPAYTYTWAPTEALDLTEPWNPIVFTLVDRTYSVTIVDPVSGCTQVATVNVEAVDEAGIMLPNDTAVCFIGEYELMATTNVLAPIAWYDNPSFTPPAIGTGNAITVILAEGDNTFWAIAGEGTGCADTSSVTITATDFQPGLELDTVNVCAGFPTPINPDGDPTYTYTWAPTDALDLTNPWNPVVTTVIDREYSVTVVDPASGCSLETEVYVQAVDEAGIMLPADTAVCFVGDYELTATTDVIAPINWYDNPTFTPPAIGTGNSITVTLAEGANTFWAIAGETFGCADTASVTVTATDFQPGLELDTVRVCAGFPTPINPNGNAAYTYTWAPTDALDLTEPWNPVVTTVIDREYSVTVVDPVSGCDIETEVYVQAVDEAGIALTPDTAVCYVGAFTLTATTDVIAPINWYDNPSFTPPAIGTGNSITVNLVEGANTFWAIAGETFGCADTASVTITATDFQPGLELDTVRVCAGFPTPINPNGDPTYTYTWAPTDALDLAEPWNPVVTTVIDREYSVTVVDPASGCELETEVYVQAVDEAGIELPNDTTICFFRRLYTNCYDRCDCAY
jgi:PKD repeat protein